MVSQEQMCSTEDNEMFCYLITTDNDSTVIYSDSAGRFPVESYAGMDYLFVCHVYKYNYITYDMNNEEQKRCGYGRYF